MFLRNRVSTKRSHARIYVELFQHYINEVACGVYAKMTDWHFSMASVKGPKLVADALIDAMKHSMFPAFGRMHDNDDCALVSITVRQHVVNIIARYAIQRGYPFADTDANVKLEEMVLAHTGLHLTPDGVPKDPTNDFFRWVRKSLHDVYANWDSAKTLEDIAKLLKASFEVFADARLAYRMQLRTDLKSVAQCVANCNRVSVPEGYWDTVIESWKE